MASSSVSTKRGYSSISQSTSTSVAADGMSAATCFPSGGHNTSNSTSISRSDSEKSVGSWTKKMKGSEEREEGEEEE